MTERERIVRMLRGERTDRLPWATRLDIWHTSRLRTRTLPREMADMDLMEIHRLVGVGRQRYATLTATRLLGVDVTVEFNGRVVQKESNPRGAFPIMRWYAPQDQAGETIVTLKTPAGKARVRFETNDELIRGAAMPYMTEHILKDDDDFRVVKWILTHAEIEPAYEEFQASEALVGDEGFTIGMINRVPFQRVYLDFMGEEKTIYATADSPKQVQYLIDILTEHGRQELGLALATPALLIELPDNFDGNMTSPRLFTQQCIPFMQEVAAKVHAQGRFLGSHMDGDMLSLVHLLPESGVDVVESFSPEPLSRLSFAKAWEAWRGKVLMWGAIPSPIFEAHFPEKEFEAWMREMLDLIGDDGHIILGIGDQAVGPSLIERVRRVSEMLGR